MKSIAFGFLFGIIIPTIALFIGLQVSSPLANLLLFPIYMANGIFDQPFGDLPDIARMGLYVFSGIFWALVFWLISWIKNKFWG